MINRKLPFSNHINIRCIQFLDTQLYLEYKKTTPKYDAHFIVHPEGQTYIELLKKELENAECKTIVAIGNVAMYALASRVGIYKWHGSVLESTLLPEKTIIPTIHPATVLPPKNVFLNKNLIIHDFKRAAMVMRGDWHPLKRTLKIHY